MKPQHIKSGRADDMRRKGKWDRKIRITHIDHAKDSLKYAVMVYLRGIRV